MAANEERAIVLADIPERNRLRELMQKLALARDAIAEQELELESLRGQLGRFEAAYEAELAREHALLRRIELLVQHFDRWVDLLQAPQELKRGHKRIEARRARDLREQAARAASEPEPEGEVLGSAPKRDERLKQAYRALARRFHPDLATNENERVRFGDMMTRINQLYQAGDVDRLLALAQENSDANLDVDIADQIALLEERLRTFESALANLRDERVAIERSATCELMRNVEQANASGRDLVAELQAELRQRILRTFPEVTHAAHRLEHEVSRYNRAATGGKPALEKAGKERALAYRFDPHADKRLVRLGLEQLRSLTVSREARAEAQRLEELAASDLALLRLLFFTYVSELSPFPLPGLESYDDVQARFDALAQGDEPPASFEKTLVLADGIVEFGVRRATEKVVHMGLRFRSQPTREAVPVLLQSLGLRREFKRILGVLGGREACGGCKQQIFAVPLFRTRGLDDLRALVCPSCGHTLRSYWMPKGKDLQSVLNPAFLDFEIVSEWSFKISRGSIAAQLLPLQEGQLDVAALTKRLHDDVFKRYDIPVTENQLTLVQSKKKVAPKTSLAELERRDFRVQFAKDVEISESDALEMLRHRIRNRFKAHA
jgi:hypothetical protein